MVVRRVTNQYVVKNVFGQLVVAVISGRMLRLAQKKISRLSRHESKNMGMGI